MSPALGGRSGPDSPERSRLYRVLPWLASAPRGAPGHPLFVPPKQGTGRVDNPERYQTLYLSDGPGGAVAEAFAWLQTWDAGMLRGPPSLSGSVQALATYELKEEGRFCDLDDARRLLDFGIRPSQVVTRDRAVTQAWALRIFDAGGWAGVRWWSYYDPRWESHGIWATDLLDVVGTVALTLDQPAVAEAADVLSRLSAAMP